MRPLLPLRLPDAGKCRPNPPASQADRASGRDDAALGHRVDLAVPVAELTHDLASVSADVRSRRGSALLRAGDEHRAVDRLNAPTPRQRQIDEGAGIADLGVRDDFLDLRQGGPFDVVLTEDAAQL